MLGLELIEDAAKGDDWLAVSIIIHRAKFPFDFFQSQQNIVLQQKIIIPRSKERHYSLKTTPLPNNL